MSVIIWPEKNAFLEQGKEKILEQFRRKFNGKAAAVYAYGSFVRDELRPDSDIDLIAIADTRLPFLDRGRLFSDVWDLYPRIDLLVYTPEEFEQLRNNPSPGFWKEVFAEMIRLL